MKNLAFIVLISLFVLSTSACNSTRSGVQKSNPEIILDGTVYVEQEYGEFITWRCKDRIEEYGKTLIEVGLSSLPELQEVGFILFDGTNSGTFTTYSREGIAHRWSWGGEDMRDYAITINPSGDGYYFDLRAAEPGETTTSKEAYKCYQ